MKKAALTERMEYLAEQIEAMAGKISILRHEIHHHEDELWDLDLDMEEDDNHALYLQQQRQFDDLNRLFQKNAAINQLRLTLQYYIEWKSKQADKLKKQREQLQKELRRIARSR